MFTIGEVLDKDVDAVKAVLLPQPRPETDVAQLLSQGGVVVVVGGRPTNFTNEHLRNPRIVFWHATDPKTNSPNRTLPANTRALLFMQSHLSHSLDNRIRKQARDRGIFSPPGHLTSGDIRELLAKMVTLPERRVDLEPKPLPVDPVPVTMPVQVETKEPPPVKLRKLHKGELKAFVLELGRADVNPTMPHAQDLLAILEKRGVASTLLSVDQALRSYVVYPARKKAGGDTSPRHPVPPTVVSTLKEPAVGGYHSPDTLLDQIAAVRQTAIDMRAGLDLQLEALAAIEKEVTRLRRAQQQTRQSLREFLD